MNRNPYNGYNLAKSDSQITFRENESTETEKKYEFRGLMIDAGRNYFSQRVGASKHFWEEIVDLMSQLELNYLHMHLTEDQERGQSNECYEFY